jgi:hypothetical protein
LLAALASDGFKLLNILAAWEKLLVDKFPQFEFGLDFVEYALHPFPIFRVVYQRGLFSEALTFTMEV